MALTRVTCSLCIHLFSVTGRNIIGQHGPAISRCAELHKLLRFSASSRTYGAHHLSADSSVLSSQPLNSPTVESDGMLSPTVSVVSTFESDYEGSYMTA